MRSLALRRPVGAAVGALDLVRHLRACMDDGHDIVIYCRVVGSDACWFGKLCALERCVICHRPNKADKVVGDLCFVVWDLEEERLQDLLDSREVGV